MRQILRKISGKFLIIGTYEFPASVYCSQRLHKRYFNYIWGDSAPVSETPPSSHLAHTERTPFFQYPPRSNEHPEKKERNSIQKRTPFVAPQMYRLVTRLLPVKYSRRNDAKIKNITPSSSPFTLSQGKLSHFSKDNEAR